eukprot:scaffold683_cov124-Cylindrotheca_fusiformis.AAC.17
MASSTGHPDLKEAAKVVVEEEHFLSDGGSAAASSSSSSVSFCLEEPSSDEDNEISQSGARKQNAFQVKLMDSQETHMSFSPTLGTQPPPKATPRNTRKRKVSLSPRDSLAKLKKSPETDVVIDGVASEQSLMQRDQTSFPVAEMAKSDAMQRSSPNRARESTTVSSVSVDKPAKKAASKSDRQPNNDCKLETASTAKSTKKSPNKRSPKKTSRDSRTPSTKPNPDRPSTKASNVPSNDASGDSRKTASPKNRSVAAVEKASSDINLDSTRNMVAQMAKGRKHAVGDIGDRAKPAEKVTTKAVSTATGSAAKKPVKKKPKKKTFQDQLLHLMFFSCKPFTMKELIQDLKASEASVNSCLLSLTDKGWVVKKEFKSKNRSKELYWANQEARSKELNNALRVVPPEEVATARRELGELQQQEKTANQQLHDVLQEPSNEELNKQLVAAEQKAKELEDKVQAALKRIQDAKQASPQQQQQRIGFGKPKATKAKPTCPKRLKLRINKMRDEWRKRKEKCNDFVDQLADGMEKKVKDVIKMLELETDELAGIKMPRKHVIDGK